jgi:alpha-mannosidase
LVGEERQNNGRKEKTSFAIVDAQSVKNTDTAENKGYDAGKKVSGIKRHIAVAWLEKCRRLWKNCERKLNTSLNMVALAFIALLLKRLKPDSKSEEA